jgi:uncharacterized membrane protein YagU involved in acid resistance
MDSGLTRIGKGLRTAILAGLVAGLVDIGAAIIINHLGPIIILQSIASGLLGMSAYAGGAATAGLGLLLHLAMSITIAGIFVLASFRLTWLRRRRLLAGFGYGIGIFVVMNYLVVPLSAFEPRPMHLSLLPLALNIAAMVIFGVVVSVIVGRCVRAG